MSHPNPVHDRENELPEDDTTTGGMTPAQHWSKIQELVETLKAQVKDLDDMVSSKTFYGLTPLPDEKSDFIDSLTPQQEERLKEVHMQTYIGSDDDAPDAYEAWLEDLDCETLKKYL